MKKSLIQIIISAILFAIGLLVPFSNEWITKGIYIVAYLIVGLEIVIKIYLKEKFLMSIF